MGGYKLKPGAYAQSAFRFGLLAASVAALAAVGFLYTLGAMSFVGVAYTLLLLFPVYLVFVASALSVWLGYGKDASDLRPVYRRRDPS